MVHAPSVTKALIQMFLAIVLNAHQLHFAYNVIKQMESAQHANQIHKTSLTLFLANVKFVLMLFLIARHVIILLIILPFATDANHNHTTLILPANHVTTLIKVV
jgi:hypothetical protein